MNGDILFRWPCGPFLVLSAREQGMVKWQMLHFFAHVVFVLHHLFSWKLPPTPSQDHRLIVKRKSIGENAGRNANDDGKIGHVGSEHGSSTNNRSNSDSIAAWHNDGICPDPCIVTYQQTLRLRQLITFIPTKSLIVKLGIRGDSLCRVVSTEDFYAASDRYVSTNGNPRRERARLQAFAAGVAADSRSMVFSDDTGCVIRC